jgi:phage-related holin
MPHLQLVPNGPQSAAEEQRGDVPHKAVLVKLLALLTLNAPPPWWVVLLQAAGSAALAWWTGLDPLLHTLGGLMALDYFYGTALAWRAETWTWGGAAWGITRKGMIFSAALVFSGVMVQHGSGEFRSAMTWFYIGTEALSVFRKLTAAEIPVAPPLLDLVRSLLKLQAEEQKRKK